MCILLVYFCLHYWKCTVQKTKKIFNCYRKSGLELVLPLCLRYLLHREYIQYFIFCLPCISIHPCNENQLDVIFILSLFRQSTSTCFGHICSPLSGGILYVYSNWYVLCFLVACLLAEWPTDRQLKSTTATNFCVCVYIYIVYLLMMGYNYARNM